jgi:uncharacterized protein
VSTPRHARPTVAPIGVGLRAPHVAAVRATRPALSFLEVHAENYIADAAAFAALADLRRDYPLSLHGVGLSLGSADGIDADHLARLAELADCTAPFLVSEHLSWSIAGGVYFNDLLPLPYAEESLAIVAANIDRAQTVLKRPLLIENPSAYLRFRHSTIAEPDFLAALARRTGCRLLCDVNNIHVTCANLALDPLAYLDALSAESIAEIHLAGHARVERDGATLLIDDHGAPVADEVWTLYRRAVARFGSVPTLVEWDRQLPPLPVLLDEARKAEAASRESLVRHADAA